MTVDKNFISLVLEKYGKDHFKILEIGKKVISGVGAPCSPLNGTVLLQNAARLGNAEASRLLSGLYAQGVIEEENLGSAYKQLGISTSAGDEKALQYQEILRKNSCGSYAEAKKWIEHDSEAKVIKDEIGAVIYEKILDSSFCEFLIKENSGRLQPAEVFDSSTAILKRDLMRDNLHAQFDALNINLPLQIIRKRVAKLVNVSSHQLESPEILCYRVGERYKPHYDFFHPKIAGLNTHIQKYGQRVKTCLIYLNNNYRGGETFFPKYNISVRANVGDMLVFDNVSKTGEVNLNSLHEGLPPTTGEKWLLAQWVRDKEQFYQ